MNAHGRKMTRDEAKIEVMLSDISGGSPAIILSNRIAAMVAGKKRMKRGKTDRAAAHKGKKVKDVAEKEKCYHCNGGGHWKRNCPNSWPRGRIKVNVIYL